MARYRMQNNVHDLLTEISAELEAMSRQTAPAHIALSGGSTPLQWFKMLSEQPWRERIAWTNLNFWWGDERCVPQQSEESNFGQAFRTLFAEVSIRKTNLHPIFCDGNSARAAEKYAGHVRTLLQCENPAGEKGPTLPRFDWVILGIGGDGHCASIFPGRQAISAQTDMDGTPLLYFPAAHPETGQPRVSISEAAILAARRISFLVTGSAKAEILSRVCAEKSDSPDSQLPARRILRSCSSAELFLDTEAAALLPELH